MSKVAVLQSNYIPWKGYFDIIHDVDLFVFYDDVQYTKNDWRNRNRIKTPEGTCWLTVPVGTSLDRRICEVELPDRRWAEKHWKSLQQFYGKAPHFSRYADFLKHTYMEREWDTLSDLNQYLVRAISSELLNLPTAFADSRDYVLSGRRQERLLELLKATGAMEYLSGPSAQSYIEPEAFAEAGITLIYKDYAGYPEYPQFHPPFTHNVTILDLLFHTGPDAPYYIWGWREEQSACD